MNRLLKPLTLTLMLLFIAGCSSSTKIIETAGNEKDVANECKNQNFNIELDCYDLISHKNSFAQLRLGINAQYKGNFKETMERYEMAKKQKNFYANALIADLYLNGFGVSVNEKEAISLLKETRKIDPIAAYKLSLIYLKDNDISDAIELMEFAGENNLRDAQKKLISIYSEGEYIDPDFDKSMYWKSKLDENNRDFKKDIYGK